MKKPLTRAQIGAIIAKRKAAANAAGTTATATTRTPSTANFVGRVEGLTHHNNAKYGDFSRILVQRDGKKRPTTVFANGKLELPVGANVSVQGVVKAFKTMWNGNARKNISISGTVQLAA
jgi:hypothetical protein